MTVQHEPPRLTETPRQNYCVAQSVSTMAAKAKGAPAGTNVSEDSRGSRAAAGRRVWLPRKFQIEPCSSQSDSLRQPVSSQSHACRRPSAPDPVVSFSPRKRPKTAAATVPTLHLCRFAEKGDLVHEAFDPGATVYSLTILHDARPSVTKLFSKGLDTFLSQGKLPEFGQSVDDLVPWQKRDIQLEVEVIL